MDLLRVPMHEFGHLPGYEYEQDGVLPETWSAGERLTVHGVEVYDCWWLAQLPDLTKRRDRYGWWL